MKRALTTAKLHLKRKIQFKIYVHDFEPTCVNFRFSTMREFLFAVSDLKAYCSTYVDSRDFSLTFHGRIQRGGGQGVRTPP